MAEPEEETYGEHNTKLSTILHSALASWSGYGYQGQCAMLHALKLLEGNRDDVKNYYLSLESYEDFAIMEATGRIVSLHQCKCYSKNTGFAGVCETMSDKREYYSKVLNICAEDVPYYFHSNIASTVHLKYNVEAYEFELNKRTCDADKIMELIKTVVKNYLTKYSIGCSEEEKSCVLTNMIDTNIAAMHKLKNITSNKVWEIATEKSNWIPFSDIITTLEKPAGTIESETLRALSSRNTINTYMTKSLNDDRNDDNYENKEAVINKFLNKLNSLDYESLVKVIRRLHPHVVWNENCVDALRSPEKVYNMYYLLTSTHELTDYNTFSWKEEGVLKTPSTLGKERYSIKHAEDIRKNPVIAFLCDYRWIVGNIDETIDNIMDKAPSMVDSDMAEELERITRPSKLGLLSINDNNIPDYVKNHS